MKKDMKFSILFAMSYKDPSHNQPWGPHLSTEILILCWSICLHSNATASKTQLQHWSMWLKRAPLNPHTLLMDTITYMFHLIHQVKKTGSSQTPALEWNAKIAGMHQCIRGSSMQIRPWPTTRIWNKRMSHANGVATNDSHNWYIVSLSSTRLKISKL